MAGHYADDVFTEQARVVHALKLSNQCTDTKLCYSKPKGRQTCLCARFFFADMEKSLLSNLICFTPACAGVVTDIERFVRRFVSSWQPNYICFKELFKEMQMSTIFMGRRNIHSLRAFVRQLLIIVTTYCFPPHDDKTRICGIYLLYAMYFLQPEECNMKVHISLEQLVLLRQFMEQLRSRKESNPFICLLRLFRARAFLFCQFMIEYNPFGGYRSLDSLLTSEQKETFSENSSSLGLLDNILSSDVLQTIVLIQRKLVELLSKPQAESLRSLLPPVIYEDIGKEIETIISNAKKKINNPSERESHETADPSSQADVEVVEDGEDVPSTSTGNKSLLERREALKRFAYSYIPSRPRPRWGIEEENECSLDKETPKTASPTPSLEQTKENSVEEDICVPLKKPLDCSSQGIRRSARIKARRTDRTSRRSSNESIGEPAATISVDVNLPASSGLEMDPAITGQAEEEASCTSPKRGRRKRARR
ncbi:hypothetical protein M514_10887 [Trichuris suis]|uniref:snRNA-activating protein complex subunit 1 n=1 Tax=Trichuris suis TaxID=68888 RepID=A0A085NJZ4_9BILA|nr:hypothetical protein M514_10887 [Trichuris suis]